MKSRSSVARCWLLAFATLSCGQQLTAQSGKTNPLQLSFHHVTASVADLDKESDWYERVLGFTKSEPLINGDFAAIHMTMPGFRIDLVKQKGSIRQHEAQGNLEQGWLHVVFKTPAVDAAYQFLLKQKTDVKADRNAQSAITRLVFHDPEGNELEMVPEGTLP